MIILSANEITKHFGPEPVLDRVSVEVRPGRKIGLVGPNGAGKTTLLNILAGRLEADAGRLELHPACRLDYLEQQPQWGPGRTLWEEARSALDNLIELARQAEDVAHALAAAEDDADRERFSRQYDRLQQELTLRDAYRVDHKVERVLDGLGFSRASHDQAVESLSGGQQNRLMLARLLLREPDLMLLDEPSNHLDIEATEWLESFLAESPQAVVVVSHDRWFLDKVTNVTWELYHGTIDEFTGNFSAYWRQKAERLVVQERTYEKQRIEIAKTEEFIRRNFYGQKATQAKDREKKLARIERIAPPRKIEAPAMGFPPADRTGDLVLRVEGLSKAYGRPLFSNLTFDIERGARWGILGPNGTGKTTLLRCIVGQVAPDAGRVTLGVGVRVGYYDQLLSGLDERATVVEAVRPPGKEFTEPQRRSLLARFGLQGNQVFQTVDSLSGGERSRAALAQLSASDVNFLILDEPTNHLDLWACDSLERSLLEFDGTVLFVSHDRYFLNRVADHVLAVEQHRFRTIDGNYDTYLHLVKRGLAGAETAPGQAAARQAVKKPSTAADSRPGKPKRRFPYRKVSDIEAEIFEHETKLAAFQEELTSPEVLRDGRRVKEVQVAIAACQQALAPLYEHWEEASQLN